MLQDDMSLLLAQYLNHWELIALSQPLMTTTSLLQKVQDSDGQLRMLKITEDPDEIRGIEQLTVWSKEGNSACVKVIKTAHSAILLDYAEGSQSLLLEALQPATHLLATEKLANSVWQLHQTPMSQFKELRSLRDVFESLLELEHDSLLLQKAKRIAGELFSTSRSVVPLHGDAHHGNLLYFSGNQLWAIDSKGFYGEHYFDYLPLFINPDLGVMRMDSELFESKLGLICRSKKNYLLERSRLIRWIYVGAALSMAWFLEDQMWSEAEQQLILLQWIVDNGFL